MQDFVRKNCDEIYVLISINNYKKIKAKIQICALSFFLFLAVRISIQVIKIVTVHFE